MTSGVAELVRIPFIRAAEDRERNNIPDWGENQADEQEETETTEHFSSENPGRTSANRSPRSPLFISVASVASCSKKKCGKLFNPRP
jgi:hypothetical protein